MTQGGEGDPFLPYVSLPLADFIIHPFPIIYRNHEYNKLSASYLSPSSELLKLWVVFGNPSSTLAVDVGNQGSFVGTVPSNSAVWLTLYTDLNSHI